MKVVWSPEAVSQVNAILMYVGEDDARAADEWLARLLDTVENLAAFPSAGRAILKQQDEFAREFIFGNYHVAYFARPKHIEIVSVWHGARRTPGRGIAGALDDE